MKEAESAHMERAETGTPTTNPLLPSVSPSPVQANEKETKVKAFEEDFEEALKLLDEQKLVECEVNELSRKIRDTESQLSYAIKETITAEKELADLKIEHMEYAREAEKIAKEKDELIANLKAELAMLEGGTCAVDKSTMTDRKEVTILEGAANVDKKSSDKKGVNVKEEEKIRLMRLVHELNEANKKLSEENKSLRRSVAMKAEKIKEELDKAENEREAIEARLRSEMSSLMEHPFP